MQINSNGDTTQPTLELAGAPPRREYNVACMLHKAMKGETVRATRCDEGCCGDTIFLCDECWQKCHYSTEEERLANGLEAHTMTFLFFFRPF